MRMNQAEAQPDDGMEDTTDDGADETGGETADPEDDGGEATPEALAEPAPAAPEAPAAPAPMPKKKKPVDPDANTVVVTGHPHKAAVVAQDLDNEAALFDQDLQRGHIKPETMESLYGKKDTLGKIGTLFGLLVSGAGSGLSGQPNAVLEMMKNTIANDMEAQKASNTNAQNWLRLSQQHQLNKAGIGLTEAQTGQAKASTELSKAHTSVEKQIEYEKALANAGNAALLGVKLRLMGIKDGIPPGPTRDLAEHTLTNQVIPAINAEIKTNNAKTGSKVEAQKTLSAPPQEKASTTEGPQHVNVGKIQELEYKGVQNEKLGLTGLTGPKAGMNHEQAVAAKSEAAMVDQNRDIVHSWKKGFEHLDKLAIAGKLNKNDYDATVSPILSQLSQSMPQAEAQGLGRSMFPAWDDWGTARATKISQTMDHFRTMEAKTPNLNIFGLKPPFPPPPAISKEANKTGTAPPKEGATGKDKASGRATVYKGGKWVFKK